MSVLPRPRKTLNKPLLRRVAMRLRRLRHESHYNQRVYIDKTDCGTAACVAGWVLLADGWKPKNITDWREFTWMKGRFKTPNTPETAGNILGMPRRAAMGLFDYQEGNGPISWPQSYRARWDTNERHSRIAADLLDAIADGKVLATASGLVEVETANG